MIYKKLMETVRELSGADEHQAAEIILTVVKEFGLDPGVDYSHCKHTSTRMMEHYARTGVCGICAHDASRSLATEVVRLRDAQGVTAANGIGVQALAAQALATRYEGVIRTHARCAGCGAPFLKTRRVGCEKCRDDRAWLAKRTRTSTKRK